MCQVDKLGTALCIILYKTKLNNTFFIHYSLADYKLEYKGTVTCFRELISTY